MPWLRPPDRRLLQSDEAFRIAHALGPVDIQASQIKVAARALA
jgi:hypothetical protein